MQSICLAALASAFVSETVDDGLRIIPEAVSGVEDIRSVPEETASRISPKRRIAEDLTDVIGTVLRQAPVMSSCEEQTQ
jgi:hypothetical protein